MCFGNENYQVSQEVLQKADRRGGIGMEWQDVETAPKDGSSILIRTKGGRVTESQWHIPRENSLDGWWANKYGMDMILAEHVTGWMTLPLADHRATKGTDTDIVNWLEDKLKGGGEISISNNGKWDDSIVILKDLYSFRSAVIAALKADPPAPRDSAQKERE